VADPLTLRVDLGVCLDRTDHSCGVNFHLACMLYDPLERTSYVRPPFGEQANRPSMPIDGIATDLVVKETALGLIFLLIYIAPSTILMYMGKKTPNPHAQALGSLGGKARAKSLSDVEIAKIASQGGKARAEKLSAAALSRIAKLAVAARERKRKGNN
jgi:hypothetical protein